MEKDRKVNTIRALKNTIDFYKRQTVKPAILYNTTELKHLRIQQVFSREEVMEITRAPKEMRTSIFKHRIAKAFNDSIGELPVKTEFDEDSGTYKVSLDFWVEQKTF